MNELIKVLLEQNKIPEEGLQELVLTAGDTQPLDAELMEELFNKCTNLKKLRLTEMFK